MNKKESDSIMYEYLTQVQCDLEKAIVEAIELVYDKTVMIGVGVPDKYKAIKYLKDIDYSQGKTAYRFNGEAYLIHEFDDTPIKGGNPSIDQMNEWRDSHIYRVPKKNVILNGLWTK